MKINRSSKLALKYKTAEKSATLQRILTEHGRVVNIFITMFWDKCPENREILKPVYDGVESWFSSRMRQVAAKEAAGMVRCCRNKDVDASRNILSRLLLGPYGAEFKPCLQ